MNHVASCNDLKMGHQNSILSNNRQGDMPL